MELGEGVKKLSRRKNEPWNPVSRWGDVCKYQIMVRLLESKKYGMLSKFISLDL